MEFPRQRLSTSDRMWAAGAHLSALLMYVTGILHIIAPLIIWIWKRDSNRFVAQEALEALNFNISITIYSFVAFLLCFVLIGFPILFAIPVFQIACIIVAGVTAGDGRPFRYPLTFRFVRQSATYLV